MATRSLALALALLAAPAPAAEVAKLHVLVATDTTDDNLKMSVERDERRVTDLFRSLAPPDRVAITPVSGSLSRGRLLDEIGKLKVGADDGVVFYYAGHGGKDAKTGRLFLAAGWKPEGKLDPLFRDEVLRALAAKKPALTVLLTDCCSNPIDLTRKSRGLWQDGDVKDPANVRSGTAYLANMRQLFLEARGVVDVTASTDDVSWGTVIRGGFFTYSLAKAIDSDTRVGSWKELVEKVSRETPNLHADQARRGFVPALPRKEASYQTPRAYSLGTPEKLQYAAVTLWTPEAAGMTFRYRWSDGSAWQTITLLKRQPQVVYVLAPGGKPLPTLEVDIADAKGARFVAKPFEGAAPPTPADGEWYQATLPKK